MRIVLLGPPGSGKTNVSNRIGEYCDLPVITSNNVLTRAAAEDSELGRLAKEAMDTNRVSDELLLALLRVRLSHREVAGGFVLVDFPRNAGQADVVDGILDTLGRPLDLVLFIAVDGDELMERLVGRIQCDHCGAKFNLYINPPLVEGICDSCGARVNRRPDDYEETISNRLRIYDGLMGPLLQYYQLHGKLPRTVIETEPVSEPAVSIDETQDELAIDSGVETVPADSATKPRKKRKAKPKIAKDIKSKPATKEGPATKKTQGKKVAAKKGVSKKVGTKKAVAEKQRSQLKKTPIAKKTPGKKKVAVKKLAAKKKATAKKQAAKKVVAKKSVSKTKVGAKKTIAKKVLKKSVAKKAGPSSKKPVRKSVPSKKKAAAKSFPPKKKSVSKKPSGAQKSAALAAKRKTSDQGTKSKKKAKAKK